MNTLKRQKEHYNEFIEKKPAKPFPKDIQEKLDHGTKNEVSVSSTLNILLTKKKIL